MKERLNSKRIATLTAVAALGGLAACGKDTSSAHTVPKKPACNPAADIKKLAHNVQRGKTFRWRALDGGEPDSLVTVEPKDSQDFRAIVNPLIIVCGKKVVHYVGITSERNDLPGKQYEIDDDLYLNVAEPADVNVSSDSDLNHVVRKDFREQTVHPGGPPNTAPGFVPQPVAPHASQEAIADSAYGLMANGL